MRNKRIYIISAAILLILIALVSFLLILTRTGKEYTVSLYYKNTAGNNLDFEARIIPHEEDSADIQVFNTVLTELKSGPKANTSLVSTFGDVEFLSSSLDETEKTAYVDLSPEFWEKSSVDKLFMKSSLVYTLTALGFVDNVVITSGGRNIDEVPLNRKNVLLNPDIASEKINYRTITLYFADSTMSCLCGEPRLLEVKQSLDTEYQLVDLLLGGPESADLVSPIPSGTKLINTTTENGVCYVNLSSAFLNRTGGGLNRLQVYSVVNSLTSLDSVNSVQLYIEGQRVNGVAGEVDISSELERDESLIKQK